MGSAVWRQRVNFVRQHGTTCTGGIPRERRCTHVVATSRTAQAAVPMASYDSHRQRLDKHADSEAASDYLPLATCQLDRGAMIMANVPNLPGCMVSSLVCEQPDADD
ncbi:hypothetical protein BaRGS_00002501 [Batillaria attramentaria]|uniref:Uncharacterized protein n=1 Tax=Batillaria attramentaria TaxID=370345 RepID=A0ABD0M3C4_9CAEN